MLHVAPRTLLSFSALGVSMTLLAATAVHAQKAVVPKPEAVDRLVMDGFKSAAPEWQARLKQDETQKVCSATRNAPSAAQAAAIRKREKASIKYPDDGKLTGDWKKGEALAQSGYGWRYTDYPPRQENGGNCYACHQLDKKELSYGTLGPSLAEYGKIRKFKAEEAKEAYAKIFNAQSVQACSNMPRFGYHKYLTEQQMKDVTAYLFDPESPVNKP